MGTDLVPAESARVEPRFGRFARRARVGGPEILTRRLRRELTRHMVDGERVRFCVRGDLGHALVCLDDRLLVLKSGFHAGTTFGTQAATIFYRDVTGIQVRMHLVSGWIEISSPSFQGRERKRTRHPRTSDRDVYKLPNCVPIHRSQLDTYAEPLAELRAARRAGEGRLAAVGCRRRARAPVDARRCGASRRRRIRSRESTRARRRQLVERRSAAASRGVERARPRGRERHERRIDDVAVRREEAAGGTPAGAGSPCPGCGGPRGRLPGRCSGEPPGTRTCRTEPRASCSRRCECR